MALRSGLASQIGYGEETTVGTYATPTRFLEFNDEGLGLGQELIDGAGLRASNRVLRTDRTALGAKTVGGTVTHEVHSKGFSLLLKHMHGKAATIATSSGGTNSKDHTYDGLGDPYGLALTVQKGVPDVGGTVRPFSYLGCKVTEWELSNSVNGLLMLNLTFDGIDEENSSSLASASYPSSSEILNYTGGVLNIASSAVDVKDVSIRGTVGYGDGGNRHFIRASRLKKEHIADGIYVIEGTVTAEFESLTAYNRFINKTLAQLDVTWTGATAIEGAFYPYLKVTLANVQFTGETPKVSGPGVVMQPLPFRALYDGTNGPIVSVYRTSDTSA